MFLSVEADKDFRREGIDLYTDLNVDYLGAWVVVLSRLCTIHAWFSHL